MNRILVFLICAVCAMAGQAMTVEVKGNVVFATGPVGDDLAQFEAAFEKPGVDTVALVNSPGGDLWTGLRVGGLIASRGLNTVAAGSCVSACSIMFMAGKQRSFSDVFRPAQTFIGIHGAHDRMTKAVNPVLQPQIFAFYKLNMSERFNAAVMNQALYDMEDAGSLLRVFDAVRLPKRVPFHCKSAQTLRKDCTEFKDQDALSLGIVTVNAFTALDLPPSFKQLPMVLGQELKAAFPDMADQLKQMSDQFCKSDPCRKLLADYPTLKDNKAIAVAVAEGGLGTTGNRDTTINAFVGAIYACNHVRGQPARLCEARVTNGYDVSDLYASAHAAHVEALAKLSPPPDKFYGNEEYGGAMTSATGLRTQRVHDITPQKIDGIKVYGTQELAVALKSPQPPLVIDVWAAVNDAIPSAVTLLMGGLAFEDANGDAVYEGRFAGLLKALSPDPAKPVVFYCQSRDCWLSVNAALRAKKLGYSQVGWYRGGMESWKAASLPVGQVIVRAVVR
jgi:PQQ-dependent catabolism-associated CXXCW motif protein